MSDINQIVRKAILLSEIDSLEKEFYRMRSDILKKSKEMCRIADKINKKYLKINEIGEELLRKEQESLIKSNQ
jgi:hypothetical protein